MPSPLFSSQLILTKYHDRIFSVPSLCVARDVTSSYLPSVANVAVTHSTLLTTRLLESLLSLRPCRRLVSSPHHLLFRLMYLRYPPSVPPSLFSTLRPSLPRSSHPHRLASRHPLPRRRLTRPCRSRPSHTLPVPVFILTSRMLPLARQLLRVMSSSFLSSSSTPLVNNATCASSSPTSTRSS